MAVFLFHSTSDTGVFAFSDDETGANLPAEFAPWERPPGALVPINTAGLPDAATIAIAHEGYFLGRAVPPRQDA